ncbi:MAG: cysteine-rich CWC family protein [Burkholderiales bacterium]|nr:cysteine-rich CWC family protein [Burkholderiales bacterium]
MNTRPASIDATRCPLCGGDNACAMASGHADRPCWCTQLSFDAGLLARVPADAKGAACICRRCAETAGRSEAGGGAMAVSPQPR